MKIPLHEVIFKFDDYKDENVTEGLHEFLKEEKGKDLFSFIRRPVFFGIF